MSNINEKPILTGKLPRRSEKVTHIKKVKQIQIINILFHRMWKKRRDQKSETKMVLYKRITDHENSLMSPETMRSVSGFVDISFETTSIEARTVVWSRLNILPMSTTGI